MFALLLHVGLYSICHGQHGKKYDALKIMHKKTQIIDNGHFPPQ